MGKLKIGDIILKILQILIIFYSLPLFFLALLALPGVTIYGERVPFWEGTGFGLILLTLGLVIVGSQIWVFIRRRKGPLPKWLEYVIAFAALGPIVYNLLGTLLIRVLFR